MKTVNENEDWFFFFSLSTVKKSYCYVKSRKRAVNKRKCRAVRDACLASLTDTSLLMVSFSSDYNLFLDKGHC